MKKYIIIDEYDQFTNELLGYDTEHFKHFIDRKGEVRSWYETLKIGNQRVVDRMFITGVAPVTLDNLSSGFNIASNITLDERYIKHTYNIVLMTLKNYNVISELESNRRYIDLLIVPKDTRKDYYSILIEFKYLKKSEEYLLEETKAKAKEQILEYSNLEKIKSIQKLKKYTVVAVVDELYVDEI